MARRGEDTASDGQRLSTGTAIIVQVCVNTLVMYSPA
jgi:hypothetical protein